MSFILPELVVESVIRDGLANLRANPQIVDDVFGMFLRKPFQRKYGQKELDKIKKMVVEKQIAVVFSYYEVDSQSPCFSIMVGTDDDDKRTASLGDFRRDVFEDKTDPDSLAKLILVDQTIVQSWDPQSGELVLSNDADLSQVTKNNLVVNENNVEYTVSAVVDTPTLKAVYVKNGESDSFEINDVVTIKSSLDFNKYEVNGVNSDVKVVIGVHTKDALTTKYMYLLLKHLLLSRKKDLIKRCLIVSSFSGSDFGRDIQYAGDRVYTRFLTLTGKVEDSWKQSEVTLIEDIQPTVLVPKAQGPNPQTTESLGLEDQTIQIADDEEDPPTM